MVITDTHAKGQGQRSVSLKDRVETDGQMGVQTDRQKNRQTGAIALQ